jgi:hypothetical protein
MMLITISATTGKPGKKTPRPLDNRSLGPTRPASTRPRRRSIARANDFNRDPEPGQPGYDDHDPTVDPQEPSHPAGSDYEDFLAYLPHHTYIYRPTRDTTWTKDGVNAALPWPEPAVVNGKPKKIPPNTIIDRTAPIRCMSWLPGEPEVMIDCAVVAGGRIVKKRCHTYNLYQPPTLKPVEGDASPWLDHVERIYPDDWGHIVDCLAFKVQHPGAKINHALVLGGPPRIGKDALRVPVREAVGQWNVAEVSPEKVLSQWNDYQQSVICRISEAKDLGDFNRYNFYEATKVLIAASPDTVLVNSKYRPLIYIANVTLAVITTNHRVGAMYLPRDDLRHYVCWSEAKFEDFDKDYFNELFDWYDNENGCAIVADYLLKRDLSRFNPKAPPKLTPAFWAMVDRRHGVVESERRFRQLAARPKEQSPNAASIRAMRICCVPQRGQQTRGDVGNRRQTPNCLRPTRIVQSRGARCTRRAESENTSGKRQSARGGLRYQQISREKTAARPVNHSPAMMNPLINHKSTTMMRRSENGATR